MVRCVSASYYSMFKCLDHGPSALKDSVNIFRMFTLEPERAQSQEILKYFIFTTQPFQSLPTQQLFGY